MAKGTVQGSQSSGAVNGAGRARPNDRAVFVNLEGFFYLSKGKRTKPLTGEEKSIGNPSRASDDMRPPLFNDPRNGKLTSILCVTGEMMLAPGMQNRVTKSGRAQAAAPIGRFNKLMSANCSVRPAAKSVVGELH